MRSPAVALFLLIAVGGGIVLLARPGAEASPATYTVNSTADPGDGTCDGTECTLREAITAANANAGTDTVEFDIPGPHTISPGSALPTITDPVIIDGTSEPDFAGTPVIELDGTNAGGIAAGLNITAGDSTVKGLVINRFGSDGIKLSAGGGNTIEGNYIGTDVTGTLDRGNGYYGLVISDASNNTIGGTATGTGNVISGNGYIGVAITGSGATGNVVLGNFIGTDVNGTADLGNDSYGVSITSGASNNTIGGTTAEAGNVVSGSNWFGVFITGSATTGNVLQGNYIGTDVNGTADLGNLYQGVAISGAPNNTIGGTAAGAGNVISGNGSRGISISSSGATGNVVQGNYIGTDVSGTADLGNTYDGVYIMTEASNNTIGGTTALASNIIAFNGGDGVRVNLLAAGNTIRGNSIHSNTGKGIENINGGNNELPPPIIDSVGSVSGHTDPKCQPCTVEVFSDDEDEGRIYHGSTTTNDDATGTWTYTGALTGPYITATITDAGGNTSEFSASPVGGLAELPDISDSTSRNHIALAGLTAAALLALSAGDWYAGRRWLG